MGSHLNSERLREQAIQHLIRELMQHTSVPDRDQQLQVITHGMPVEIAKPLEY
jgi:hypothetical protein